MLSEKQNVAGDLASHMFGHLVSAEVARDILTTFINDGVVQVFEGQISHDEQVSDAPFSPHSEDVQRAVAEAFEATTAHDCIHPGDAPAKPSLAVDQQKMKEEKIYSFRWRSFPKEPSNEDELVSFLNEITDRAFAAMKPHLVTRKLALRHRFAAPKEKRYVARLTYDPDRGNMEPPQFFLLPIEAFSGDNFQTVDRKWVNFSAARLVGVSNEDLVTGLDDMQCYAQGLKNAQPWVFYVPTMTFSLDTVFLSRVDPSGWEHLPLLLWDGRGSIDFVRILLGLALADGVNLGQNPFIVLGFEPRTFRLEDLHGPSDALSSNEDSQPDDDDSPDDDSSDDDSSDDDGSDDNRSADDGSDDAMSTASLPSSCRSAPASLYQITPEKRNHSAIEKEDDNEDDPQLKKHKIAEAD